MPSRFLNELSRRVLVRLPWDYAQYGSTADDTRVVDAVRASMSIPFYFRPVQVDQIVIIFFGVHAEGADLHDLSGLHELLEPQERLQGRLGSAVCNDGNPDALLFNRSR